MATDLKEKGIDAWRDESKGELQLNYDLKSNITRVFTTAKRFCLLACFVVLSWTQVLMSAALSLSHWARSSDQYASSGKWLHKEGCSCWSFIFEIVINCNVFPFFPPYKAFLLSFKLITINEKRDHLWIWRMILYKEITYLAGI